ncbi:MAG: M28 family peptidase [Eggerthellaceae bacterium]|nr:M28 family peptidase [Eggerthellaceae bacterium]
MDMVCVDEDPNFDPINTPIRTIIDEEKGIMYAEGTSLGADNALGVAMAMKVAVDNYEHDALRIIVTIGEEAGFVGTNQLDTKHFQSIRYLLNLDHSQPGESVVSCAGNAVTEFKNHVSLLIKCYNVAIA